MNASSGPHRTSSVERFCTLLAALLFTAAVVELVLGGIVLGATLLALAGAAYVYATTPQPEDEPIR